MPRFVQFLQIIIAIAMVSLISYDFVMHGITVFEQKYVLISIGLCTLLELALFVIYKLIEDD